jgi:hypothetical protein
MARITGNEFLMAARAKLHMPDLLMVDAREGIEFEVTEADIRDGKCGDIAGCALARALRRSSSGVKCDYALVIERYAGLVLPGTHTLVRFVHSYYRAVKDFDHKKDACNRFKPGIYEIRVPPPSQSIGYEKNRGANRGQVGKWGKRRKTVHAQGLGDRVGAQAIGVDKKRLPKMNQLRAS